VSKACLAGLGLALILAIVGTSAAQAQRQQQQRVPPAQSVPAEPQPESTPPAQPLVDPTPAPPFGQGPVFDWRPREPVPIRVVPTPKSEQELVVEQQERAQRSALESNLMLLVMALVGIGFLQLVVMAIQGIFLLVGLSAMRRPMDVIERNLAFSQRAFVYVGSLAAHPVRDTLRVIPSLENGGATPTRSLRISTNWRALHGEPPTDFVYNYTVPPARIFLPARGRAQAGAVDIPNRDVQAAIEDRVQLYIWGRATYEDVFEGSEQHFVEFCYRLGVHGSSDRPAVTFMPEGPHNRTEQDSHRMLSPEKATKI
jgi:hypothetical protein